MRFDRIIHLIKIKYVENEIGDTIKIPDRRQVFAQEKSIRQSEFYQAAASGLKPEITFIIWQHEYNGEKYLEFDGTDYTIIRTYKKNSKEIELICQGGVNNADA